MSKTYKMLKFLTLEWDISRIIRSIEVSDGLISCSFHPLSFELNLFFEQSFPSTINGLKGNINYYHQGFPGIIFWGENTILGDKKGRKQRIFLLNGGNRRFWWKIFSSFVLHLYWNLLKNLLPRHLCYHKIVYIYIYYFFGRLMDHLWQFHALSYNETNYVVAFPSPPSPLPKKNEWKLEEWSPILMTNNGQPRTVSENFDSG